MVVLDMSLKKRVSKVNKILKPLFHCRLLRNSAGVKTRLIFTKGSPDIIFKHEKMFKILLFRWFIFYYSQIKKYILIKMICNIKLHDFQNVSYIALLFL